ncbi:hypothetical protein SAMN02745121_05232 [Nannocystis exedens]|uniref:Uncharacterized protein n=1 Tax=Nannocystis exedens TaxID=54 RepID=A0A1I2CSR7_9BACT|nr:hypothetical protein NAEX_01545 [Nannocystis exedens]SFE71284.1 hypothetical protein SAMN02745121_05232 [Nannocystis exedens]
MAPDGDDVTNLSLSACLNQVPEASQHGSRSSRRSGSQHRHRCLGCAEAPGRLAFRHACARLSGSVASPEPRRGTRLRPCRGGQRAARSSHRLTRSLFFLHRLRFPPRPRRISFPGAACRIGCRDRPLLVVGSSVLSPLDRWGSKVPFAGRSAGDQRRQPCADIHVGDAPGGAVGCAAVNAEGVGNAFLNGHDGAELKMYADHLLRAPMTRAATSAAAAHGIGGRGRNYAHSVTGSVSRRDLRWRKSARRCRKARRCSPRVARIPCLGPCWGMLPTR